jgi:hypothetical protein
MKKKNLHLLVLYGLLFLFVACTKSGELVVLHQVTGPVSTNCYLLPIGGIEGEPRQICSKIVRGTSG